jgi:hypothetical protein
MSGKEVNMYNDHYSIGEIVAELRALLGKHIGVVQPDDETVEMTHSDIQAIIQYIASRRLK